MPFCNIIVLLTHTQFKIHSNLPIPFCNPVALLKHHHIVLIYSIFFLSRVVLSFSVYNRSLLQLHCFSCYLDILNADLLSYEFATPFQIFLQISQVYSLFYYSTCSMKIEQNRTDEKSLKDVTAVPSCFVRKRLINTDCDKYFNYLCVNSYLISCTPFFVLQVKLERTQLKALLKCRYHIYCLFLIQQACYPF